MDFQSLKSSDCPQRLTPQRNVLMLLQVPSDSQHSTSCLLTQLMCKHATSPAYLSTALFAWKCMSSALLPIILHLELTKHLSKLTLVSVILEEQLSSVYLSLCPSMQLFSNNIRQITCRCYWNAEYSLMGLTWGSIFPENSQMLLLLLLSSESHVGH